MRIETGLVLGVLATLVVGSVAHAISYPILLKKGLMDVPNHRSSHLRPTVRGGGIGAVLGLVSGLILTGALLPHEAGQVSAPVWSGVTVVVFAILGLFEDLRGLSVWARLGGQVLIAALAVTGLWSAGAMSLGWAIVASAFGVFYVNASNFMDGVNGISGWQGVVVGLAYACLGVLDDSVWLVAGGLIAAAAFLTFLPWNVPRARMFLGDVGSYALGGSAWALWALAVSLGTNPLLAAAPLVIYSSDVVYTLARRALRRESLVEAHREHVYQRVQQATGSHAAASLIATAATSACAVLGLMGVRWPDLALWWIVMMVLVVLGYLISPSILSSLSLRRSRFTRVEVDA